MNPILVGFPTAGAFHLEERCEFRHALLRLQVGLTRNVSLALFWNKFSAHDSDSPSSLTLP